jgi:hypothetical protein
MLLGQLYYFEKKLESVRFMVESNSLEGIEIIGVEKHFLKSLKGLTHKEIYTKILVNFSQAYTKILKAEEMQIALEIWKLITSPYKSPYKSNKSRIFYTVNHWLDGNENMTISELLNEIGITHEDDEFAIVYGLSVIKVLLGGNKTKSKLQMENTQGKNINPDIEPKIIIVCDLAVSPFLTNLNCVFIDITLNQQGIVSSIMESISRYENISLILIEESRWEVISYQIKKYTDHQILIAPLNLRDDQNIGYFDNLVKKTLGVRLV